MKKLNELVTMLREEGFRITPQRIAILDYLLKTDDHPSAEHIYQVVKKKYPMVSLSTVYKTLELFRAKKIVNEFEVGGQHRFDVHPQEHIYVVCMNCGKIEDMDEDLLKEIKQKAAKKSKYHIVRGVFEFFGYCNNCKSKFYNYF